MAVVYWLHLPEHTDIFTEGYVGVSKTTAKSRFRGHMHKVRNGSTLPVHAAIRKHGSKLVLDTVLEGPHEYCYEVEQKLRSVSNVGWNLACGGEQVTMIGRKHSEATKSAMSVARKIKGLPRTQIDAMRAGRNYQTRALQKDWNNPRSNKDVWLAAEYLHTLYKSFESCGQKRLAAAHGYFTSDNLETITVKFKGGWNPSKDSTYIDWKTENQLKATNG